VITGGAQGLGEALTTRLLKEGCRVLVADIQEQQIAATVGKLRASFGDKVEGVPCDVTVESDVAALVEKAGPALRGRGYFVANAGILVSGAITEFDVAKWRKVMEVNLVGQMICMKYALRVMERQKSGAYVQINSKSGKKGSFKNSAYAASKFGGIGLVQSAPWKWLHWACGSMPSARANLLDSPLWVNSLFKQYAQNLGISEAAVRQKYIDQVPMKRGCTYDDVCNVVVFLASDQAGYMTGQAINVTGGQEMR